MAEIEGAIKDKIETALTFIESREYQKAIDFLLDIIEFFVEVGDFEERDKFLLKIYDCFRFLAIQFRDKQDYFEAAETFISAAFLQKEHDKNKKARLLFNEAIDCFVSAGENAISKNFYKEASILYCSAAKYAKNELKNKSQSTKFYQNAIDALQKEISTHSNEEDPSIICRNQLELGKIYENLENYQIAINKYKKVVEFSTQKELYAYTAESYQYMSACYENLGNNSAVTNCLNNAVHYRLLEAEKYSDKNLPLEAVQNFIAAANCVSRLKDSEKLLKDILKSQANCFLTAAKRNAESGQILQAAYYERNAAYCYNQIGNSETSIDLLLNAAEKLLSIEEYYGAAYNYQDASLYQEQIGDLLKAANYAYEAGNFAQRIGDFEIAIQNFKRAAQFYQSVGFKEKVQSCNLKLADCLINLAELNFESNKFHIAGYLYYQAATTYAKLNEKEKTITCYEKAIEFYEEAIALAIRDDEKLLASYSTCCATFVCLIMRQLTRAESLLNNIEDNSPNIYYQLSSSLIKAFKTKSLHEYNEIHKKFYKIIQNSPEIKNMLDLTEKYL